MSADRRTSLVPVLVLTAVICIPLIPYNHYMLSVAIGRLSFGPPAPAVAKAAMFALVLFQLFTVFQLARWLDRDLSRLLKRPWSQMHLSTALLLMLGGSGLILMIFPDYLAREDLPIGLRLSRLLCDGRFLIPLFGGLVTLGTAAVFLEEVLRRTAKEQKVLSVQQDKTELLQSLLSADPSPLPPPDERTLPARVPTSRERLLGAVPMFLLFGLMIVAVPLIDSARHAIIATRCDLPDLALGALAWHRLAINYPSVCVLTMVCLSTFYFGWVAKERRRIVAFNIAIYALLWIGTLGLLLGLVLPFLSVGSCVAEDTEVDTPDGKRRIDGLQVGDEVASMVASGELSRSHITAKRAARVRSFLSLRFDDGGELRVTDLHPIALENEWRRAGELKVGDLVRRAAGLARIVSIEKKRAATTVYDLSVEPHRNFFANGVLVHNALKKK